MKLDIQDIKKRAGILKDEPKHDGANELLLEGDGIHVSSKKKGQLGNIIIIIAKEAGAIASMLGIPDGWKLKKIGSCWAAFNAGDRLSFFDDQRDYEPDEA